MISAPRRKMKTAAEVLETSRKLRKKFNQDAPRKTCATHGCDSKSSTVPFKGDICVLCSTNPVRVKQLQAEFEATREAREAQELEDSELEKGYGEWA